MVDTPAIMEKFDDAPWKNDVLEALRDCDIVFHMIRAFNDSSVEHYTEQIDDHNEYEDTTASNTRESVGAVSDIMRAHDSDVLFKLRSNDSFR